MGYVRQDITRRAAAPRSPMPPLLFNSPGTDLRRLFPLVAGGAEGCPFIPPTGDNPRDAIARVSAFASSAAKMSGPDVARPAPLATSGKSLLVVAGLGVFGSVAHRYSVARSLRTGISSEPRNAAQLTACKPKMNRPHLLRGEAVHNSSAIREARISIAHSYCARRFCPDPRIGRNPMPVPLTGTPSRSTPEYPPPNRTSLSRR